MDSQGLCARPKRNKDLARQNPAHAAPEGLPFRDFGTDGVNQKRCGDSKEAKTAEGPVFLATVGRPGDGTCPRYS